MSDRGPNPDPPKNNGTDDRQDLWVAYAKYSGLALTLPAATLIGYGVGYGLDHYFGTTYLRVVFLILGTIGGFVELIRGLTKP